MTPAPSRAAAIGPLTPHLYTPTAARPLRAKLLRLRADTRVVPHAHPWGQVALSATGVIRVTVAHGSYIVPPSRAVWIPPGVEHAVTVIEEAELLTLYLHQARGRCGPARSAAESASWRQCRVLEVSSLLLALALELDAKPDRSKATPARDTLDRERRLAALLFDELRRAAPVRLGVDLPQEKRLRRLCEAVIEAPSRHATLAAWAADTGASARTLTRLFRSELGTSFVQWRQQVLLARAVPLAARKLPMASIAAELGYASPSAFAAMVRRSVGATPSRFLRPSEGR
ncbi:MAG TPA: helix-turn-helix transcriptional regulator [Caldimonas sp.]|jgi:AraC-like DNA-binding protein|nr:helix-turn-helix transcriptional regulator [Caldimonas sp.]